ncbi:MAG TPA: DNA ligase D, partial [Burkholderiaceae bacterium]|nr:DNA ligase D [Burkholderiaceae bacterium]
RKPDDKQDPWMLFKKRDEWARPIDEYDVVAALPDSVVAHPLGLVEEREPRRGSGTVQAAAADRVASPRSPDKLTGAVKARLPARMSPQLATLTKSIPAPTDWLFEIKLDGYRVLTRIDHGKVQMITRGGHDWTAKMKPLADALKEVPLHSAWLDGEIVVLNDEGNPDFNALQNAFDASRADDIVYYLFDVPFADGHDLRKVPLASRRALLQTLLEGVDGERIRFSEAFDTDAESLMRSACSLKLEGLIAKRRDAVYVSGRTETWLKLKCSERQEFVIVGFTDRTGSTKQVGGLLLAYHEDGRLQYAGKVGTGWNAATSAELHRRLSRIEVDQPVLDPASVKRSRWSRSGASPRWVKPALIAEVAFSEWTPDGHVRHARFQGLRTDKSAQAVTREAAAAISPASPGSASPGSASPGAASLGAASPGPATRSRTKAVRISNPDRVIDPSTGLKKLDLVRYYESVAQWLLPHLKSRPVSLVRGPTGITGELFFQKHDDKLSIPGLRELDPSLWPGHAGLLEVPTPQALVNAAQMNVIEFHTWNSTSKRIDKPDRMVFDLDPGEGVGWDKVQEAALLTRTLLDELGLESWLKTSGGKGLHVVVPLSPRLDYETVKGFSQELVAHLAKTIPSRFVAKSGAANRRGKIFVDYLRNGHGQTTACAFSARARPGLGVSMPVSWDQLGALKSGAQWTIATAREYLSFQREDPWADYWRSRQTLTEAMRILGYVPRK